MTYVDAVVLAALTPDELERVVEGVACSEGRVFHSAATADGSDGGVLSAFMTRRHGDVTFVGANGLHLGPGVIYESADVKDTGVPWGAAIHTAATLRLTGHAIPQAAMAVLAGRPVSALVDHPALADPRLVVETAAENRFTVLKSRSGAQRAPAPKSPTGFHVTLPQITVAIETN